MSSSDRGAAERLPGGEAPEPLYQRIEARLARQRGAAVPRLPSGFVERGAAAARGRWRPLVALPAEIADKKQINRLADAGVLGGRLLIGVKGAGLANPADRRPIANSEQCIGLVLNGRVSVELRFLFDGSSRWLYLDATEQLGGLALSAVEAVELERDGNLLLSLALRPPRRSGLAPLLERLRWYLRYRWRCRLGGAQPTRGGKKHPEGEFGAVGRHAE